MKKAIHTPRTHEMPVDDIGNNSHFLRSPAVLAMTALFALAQLADATTYTWNVTSGNWNAPGSWNPATSVAGPTSADSAVFGAGDTVSSPTTVNNTVNVNFSITGLSYANNSTTAEYHVTQIPSGQTLTATGPVLVGGANGSTALITYAYMTGSGAFQAFGSTFTVQNYGSASGANATAYLNLSNLNTFVYSNGTGTISIEDNPNGLTRLGGNLVLAGVSNFIAAENLNLGTSTSAQAGPAGSLVLGAGTNIINVANFNLANNKSTFTATNLGGGLRIRGVSGAATDRATLTVGNRNQTGTGTCAGTLALNGCPVDIKAGTLTIGANPNTGATTGDTGTGIVQFDTGTLDASNIVMASSATANGAANGTLTVGPDGTLIIGAGGFSLVNQSASGVCTGTFNIASGGLVTNSGSITEGTTTGTGNINVGGALQMAPGTYIGTASLPINNFTLSNNAALQFGIRSASQPNAVVNALTWPADDSTLTINITSLPAGVNIGSIYALVQANNSIGGGTVTTNAVVNFPGESGIAGYVSQSGNSIVLTITSISVPSVPGDLSATAGDAQVVLNWTASTGSLPPITYDVSRSTVSGDETFLATGVSTTNYTDTSVTNGTTYYYEVSAVNSSGVQSAYSTEASATPVGPPPAPTQVIGSLLGSGQPVLTWTDADATSYNILRSTSLSGPYAQIATNITGTTYTDTNVVAGVNFYYRPMQFTLVIF